MRVILLAANGMVEIRVTENEFQALLTEMQTRALEPQRIQTDIPASKPEEPEPGEPLRVVGSWLES
jgi:hypothetical protein